MRKSHARRPFAVLVRRIASPPRGMPSWCWNRRTAPATRRSHARRPLAVLVKADRFAAALEALAAEGHAITAMGSPD